MVTHDRNAREMLADILQSEHTAEIILDYSFVALFFRKTSHPESFSSHCEEYDALIWEVWRLLS